MKPQNIPTHDPENPDAWDPQVVAAHFTCDPHGLPYGVLYSDDTLAHMRSVWHGVYDEDLLSVGNVALVRAAGRVDPTRSSQEIVTYLYQAIRRSMHHALRKFQDAYREDYEDQYPDRRGLDEPLGRPGTPGDAMTYADVLEAPSVDTEDDILRRVDMQRAVEKLKQNVSHERGDKNE